MGEDHEGGGMSDERGTKGGGGGGDEGMERVLEEKESGGDVGVQDWGGWGLERLLVEQQSRGGLSRQELVSMLPVVLLGALGDQDRVLDMCASPGVCVRVGMTREQHHPAALI
jgi:hypothetical protein